MTSIKGYMTEMNTSSAIQDLSALIAEQQQDRIYLHAFVVCKDVLDGKALLNQPVAIGVVIGDYETVKDAYDAMLVYAKKYPHITYRVSPKAHPYSIYGKEPKGDLFKMDLENWEDFKSDDLIRIEERKLTEQKREETMKEISKDNEQAEDPDHIEYLRSNFFNLCTNASILDYSLKKDRELYKSYQERKRNCIEHLDKHPENLNLLEALYEAKLIPREEGELLKVLTQALNDRVDGVPRVIHENISFSEEAD